MKQKFKDVKPDRLERDKSMINEYHKHAAEREATGIPPKPLTAQQVLELVALLSDPGKAGPEAAPEALVHLLENRVPAGVDEAARIKADFLRDIAWETVKSPLISPEHAVFLLSTMRGGYNTGHLISLLGSDRLAADAAEALIHIIYVFDAFEDVQRLLDSNARARRVMEGWAAAGWFKNRPAIPESITVTAFRVEGEINTDDLSPAGKAWSRPDIPLHALSMLETGSKTP